MFSIYIFLCNFTAAQVLFLIIPFLLPLLCERNLLLFKMMLESKSRVRETSKFVAIKSHIKEAKVTQLFPFFCLTPLRY